MVTKALSARPSNRESGQILVLTAVTMIALLGIAALSLDASFMYDKRNRLHAAADAAAKSAAIEIYRQGPGVVIGTLQNFADQQVQAHGFSPTRLGGTTSVVVNHGPSSGPFVGNLAYVEVIVSEATSTFLGRVLGATSMTPGAAAVAGTSTGSACLIAFDDIDMGNNNTLTMPGCRISAGGDMTLGMNTVINAASVGVTGSCSGCGGVTPAVQTGALPPSDPLSGLTPPTAPTHSCSSPSKLTAATTLSVTDVNSYYCGIEFNGGSLTLNPGVYYVAGPIYAKSPGKPVHITGSNVMIYLAPGGSLNIDSNDVAMNLSGRTVAPYKSMIFYQDPSNSSDAVFAKNNGDFTLTGTLYFPSALLDVKNNLAGGFGGDCFLAISRDLVLKNNGAIQNTCSAFGGSPLLTISIAQ